MTTPSRLNLYVALIHYPVLNKRGDIIASAVTNLDVHDIARVCRTYGVAEFFIVTPLEDQKRLIHRILCHWTSGNGGRSNPVRREAMEIVRLADSLREVLDRLSDKGLGTPTTVATCARRIDGAIGFRELKIRLRSEKPHLILFGTGWGLSDELLADAHIVLEPVCGPSAYNHLSVRSAAAIVLDRLAGETAQHDR